MSTKRHAESRARHNCWTIGNTDYIVRSIQRKCLADCENGLGRMQTSHLGQLATVMPESLDIAAASGSPKSNHMTHAIDRRGKAASSRNADWKAQVILLLNDCTRLCAERMPCTAALAEVRGRTSADYVSAVVNASCNAMSRVALA